ncbi:putative Na(+)/H(+) antiporter C3A11.09 [Cyphellophora attinorum]|uniref:Putative Na(+)/H(+) antiporter C3A11.09 n=1 Tax=Cyphellophora attinorum TaxID=1664694 RepID=A0A0N1H6A0_9EURO|nr:putative Na(+)/H(+) antiporter C3A11.09 [Phialophora attinorum]KPI36804.1 putative Na(+)/H(+) antiporter C3A11.09 [Phialophora attinorum]
MSWPEIEPSTSHLTYLLLSLFLIAFALFAELVRNRIHLSEPPLATLAGIAFGPRGATILDPLTWGWEDNISQEFTRVVIGVQVFTTGIELPAKYIKKHARGVSLLLGPNMVAGWFICTAILHFVLGFNVRNCLVIAACLTPTDPVLSASVLGEARFSQRIPKRLRHILSAESGCNDGSAFPLIYAGLYIMTAPSFGEGFKEWFLNVIIWQCSVGIIVGVILGLAANRALKFSEKRNFLQEATLFVFYFLLAILCVGVGATLGLDDFLVCFAAGQAFCWDGWFVSKTHKMKLPSIIDLLLNSVLFVYFGSIIPWHAFHDTIPPGKLILISVLVLLIRRLPAILALKPFIREIHTWNEALFAGHFGPMGVAAIFLAMEARARLETGTSEVLPHPPRDINRAYNDVINHVWPIVSFVVLWSIMVHGFSALVMAVIGSFSRHEKERAPLLGSETARLYGMANENGDMTDGEESGSDAEET